MQQPIYLYIYVYFSDLSPCRLLLFILAERLEPPLCRSRDHAHSGDQDGIHRHQKMVPGMAHTSLAGSGYWSMVASFFNTDMLLCRDKT